jgi:hypothetical protein
MDGDVSTIGRLTGNPITITVFVPGKRDEGLNASGTHGSNGGSSQRSAGANPTRGISKPPHFLRI